jgi:hypothetical protein
VERYERTGESRSRRVWRDTVWYQHTSDDLGPADDTANGRVETAVAAEIGARERMERGREGRGSDRAARTPDEDA